ncbi:MAG TPA: ACP S-malonyltransferase [Solirubrobacterales bacterium]|nr:ACP S-malonyltransferase [Solirubrobacterales bacterium]
MTERQTLESTAILFPGQGVGDAIDAGVVRELRPDLAELATQLVGVDPLERLGQGTGFDQPAIYCASIAAFERLGRPRSSLYAGHSLGEVAALAAAGAVDDLDGLRIAAARGRLMQEAARAAAPGGMLAVGGDRDEALALADRFGLALANENSPGQYVLTGPEPGIDAARSGARELGLRAKRLSVTGAFHSPAMEPALAPLRAELAEVDFRVTDATVISSVSGAPFEDDPRELLVAALVSPVCWVAVLERLHADGARSFLDAGPGKVLAGLVRRTLDDVEAIVGDRLEVAHA